MKTRLTFLKLTILLCFTFATTAVFGQTLIWTNPVVVGPNGNNIGVSTNWSGPAGPGLNLPVGGSTMEWNGTVPGPMVVYQDDGINHAGNGNLVGGTAGGAGGTFYINAAQTSPVQISSRVAPSVNMGFNTFTVDLGAGQLTLGDNTANRLATVGRPSGTTHDFINNSANPVIICPNFEWQNGGGAAMTLEFDSPSATPGSGIGDYGITNSLNSNNSGTVSLWFVSSGTITWNGPSLAANGVNGTIASPVFLNAGTTLILKTNGLLGSQAIQNNAPLTFGACPLTYDGNSPQTLSGIIGAGTSPLIAIVVKSGTLTLSGASVFTGDITNSGGELIAGRAETAGVNGPFGQGGTIHMFGGTLGWSLNNSFDYSSRFDTAAGQVYNFDTGGANVTLGTGLGSSGAPLTKFGNGTLTLSGASSYSGATTVSGGEVTFQGAMTGTGNITVNNGAALGAYNNGTQIQPGTLALGTTSGVSLDFYNVNSLVNTIINAGALSVQSTNLVTINIRNGTFAVGNTYPLFKWGGATPAPATQLGVFPGYVGNVITNISGKEIDLVVTDTAYTWSGINNNSWDTATANNWQKAGIAVTFVNGFQTLFDDSANSATPGQLNITNLGVVTPLTLTVNNNTNAYQISSSGAGNIGGATGLAKSGTNSLSLNGGTNTYTGVTTISGGTVIVSALANGGSASDIGAATAGAANLVLDGGGLQYTNITVNINRLLTITGNGGTIDASGVGPLSFTNTGAIVANGSGPRSLILTGTAATNNTMAPVIVDSTGGATSLVKNGAGEWDLIGNNTYSGLTTVNTGVLRIGQATATGSLGTGGSSLSGGTTLFFNRTNSLTYGGAISGGGAVVVQTGTVTLSSGGNNYSGGTSISNGVTLNFTGGNVGQLALQAAPVVDNGLLHFNSGNAFTIRGFAATVSGTGNVQASGSGTVGLLGTKSYTGWTLVDAGATLWFTVGNEAPGAGPGGWGGPAITNNGTLLGERQDNGVFVISNNIVGTGKLVIDANNQNTGDVTLYGTNTYSGNTHIAANILILGDGVTAGAGSIVGNVNFTNSQTGNNNFRELEFNRPDNFTFPGNITGTNNGAAGNRGRVLQNGTNVTTLTGANTYIDGTIVSNGVLQVGNGGTTGSIGNGTLNITATLVFNRLDSVAFSGGIAGTGMVAQAGSGTLTLSGSLANLWNTNANTAAYTAGTLTASNGTVVATAGSVGGNVNVSGGMLSPSAIGTLGGIALTNVFTNNTMTISSGGVLITVNKSLAQSNSVILASNTVNVVATGGTLKLVNYGPAFAPGDTFQIFTMLDGVTPLAVTGGGTMTVTAPGVTSFINNLGSNGSVTVQTVTASPLSFTSAVKSGANISLTWPAAWTGVHLQSQTNALAIGLTTNWVTIAGSDAANTFSAPMTSTNVFYRLAP